MRLKSSDSSNSWLWNSTPEPAQRQRNWTQEKASCWQQDMKIRMINSPILKKLDTDTRTIVVTAAVGTRYRAAGVKI